MYCFPGLLKISFVFSHASKCVEYPTNPKEVSTALPSGCTLSVKCYENPPRILPMKSILGVTTVPVPHFSSGDALCVLARPLLMVHFIHWLMNCMYGSKPQQNIIRSSGGSRISCRGGGVDLRHGHFLAKMYVKTKELGPIGGHAPGTTPRSANEKY